MFFSALGEIEFVVLFRQAGTLYPLSYFPACVVLFLSPFRRQNVRKLIAAGVLRADGTELEMEEDKEGLKSIDMEFGDVREEEAVGGEEACLLLMEKLGLNSVCERFPQLRTSSSLSLSPYVLCVHPRGSFTLTSPTTTRCNLRLNVIIVQIYIFFKIFTSVERADSFLSVSARPPVRCDADRYKVP